MIPDQLLERVVADARDRPAWLAARADKWGGSDAGGAAKLASAHLYLAQKLGDGFQGNAYTTHGNDRERAILSLYHLAQNTLMFASATNPRHVSTPDAIWASADGTVRIAEVKTTTKPLPKPPPKYLRQMQWNMGVLGAVECLFIWEQHDAFRPTDLEPSSQVIPFDRAMFDDLVVIADTVLAGMDDARRFREDTTR